jgi:hypothetical protein
MSIFFATIHSSPTILAPRRYGLERCASAKQVRKELAEKQDYFWAHAESV